MGRLRTMGGLALALALLAGAGHALAEPPVCTEAGCVHVFDEDADGRPDGVLYAGGRDQAGVNAYAFEEFVWVHGDVEAHGPLVPGEHPVVTFAAWTTHGGASAPGVSDVHAEADAWTLDHETGEYTHVTGAMAEAHDHDGDGRPDETHTVLP